MDADKSSIVVTEFVVGGWIVLKLKGVGRVAVCCIKKMHKEEKEVKGGGDKGWPLGHK